MLPLRSLVGRRREKRRTRDKRAPGAVSLCRFEMSRSRDFLVRQDAQLPEAVVDDTVVRLVFEDRKIFPFCLRPEISTEEILGPEDVLARRRRLGIGQQVLDAPKCDGSRAQLRGHLGQMRHERVVDPGQNCGGFADLNEPSRTPCARDGCDLRHGCQIAEPTLHRCRSVCVVAKRRGRGPALEFAQSCSFSELALNGDPLRSGAFRQVSSDARLSPKSGFGATRRVCSGRAAFGCTGHLEAEG